MLILRFDTSLMGYYIFSLKFPVIAGVTSERHKKERIIFDWAMMNHILKSTFSGYFSVLWTNEANFILHGCANI